MLKCIVQPVQKMISSEAYELASHRGWKIWFWTEYLCVSSQSGQFRWHMFRNNHHLYWKPTAACQTLQVIYYREIVRATLMVHLQLRSGHGLQKSRFFKDFWKIKILVKRKKINLSQTSDTTSPPLFDLLPILCQSTARPSPPYQLKLSSTLAFFVLRNWHSFCKMKNASNKISLDFDTVNMFFKNVWHNVETLLI